MPKGLKGFQSGNKLGKKFQKGHQPINWEGGKDTYWRDKAREISCEDCIYDRQIFSGKKPDCIKCGFVIVTDGNLEVVDIIDRYPALLTDGMGGINTSAINIILGLEEVENKILFMYKIQLYLATLLKKSNEGADSGVNIHGQTSVKSNIRSR